MSGARTEVALDQLLNELRYLFYFVHNREPDSDEEYCRWLLTPDGAASALVTERWIKAIEAAGFKAAPMPNMVDTETYTVWVLAHGMAPPFGFLERMKRIVGAHGEVDVAGIVGGGGELQEWIAAVGGG